MYYPSADNTNRKVAILTYVHMLLGNDETNCP